MGILATSSASLYTKHNPLFYIVFFTFLFHIINNKALMKPPFWIEDKRLRLYTAWPFLSAFLLGIFNKMD